MVARNTLIKCSKLQICESVSIAKARQAACFFKALRRHDVRVNKMTAKIRREVKVDRSVAQMIIRLHQSRQSIAVHKTSMKFSVNLPCAGANTTKEFANYQSKKNDVNLS